MQPFEFILVLVSIIIGLGITEVLATQGRVLRGELRAGLIHTIWSAVVLTLLVQQFWSEWFQSGRDEWSFVELTVTLVPPLLLFLTASLISPATVRTSDLDAFFLERKLPFFVVLAFVHLSYAMEDWVLTGGALDRNVMRGAAILLFALLAVSKSKRVQLGGACVEAALLLYFTLTVTATLSGMGGS
jgi:hypothetical protein